MQRDATGHKIGTADGEAVYVNVGIEERDGKRELHITADIYRDGHDVGGGQSLDTVRRVAEHGTVTPEWPRKRILKLLSIWERWHLNGMRAGCEHQRELGWTSYNKHPSEPCPTCGYKYGTSWLYEPLPPEVEEFVAELP